MKKHEPRAISDEASFHIRRKQIMCPKCGMRMLDAAEGTKTQILPLSGADATQPDYYMKCRYCRAEIGFRKMK